MPEIQPFQGLRYRLEDHALNRVLAPPYDVITPGYRDELLARDPRNVVRIVLSPEQGDRAYSSAAEAFARLVSDGTLVEDPSPSLYLLQQQFDHGGTELSRLGLLARFRAEDPETRAVLPHEQTRKGPREDRFRLLKVTRANFSPIFMMFADRGAAFRSRATALVASPPLVSYSDDAGVAHRLWRVSDPEAIADLAKALRRAPTYIADGHHRYATALRYRDEVSPDGAWTFGYFAPMEDAALRVLPYHRIVSSGPALADVAATLGPAFRVSAIRGPHEAAARAAVSEAPHAYGLAEPGGSALLVEALPDALAFLPASDPPSLRALDTYFLHRVVLPRLGIGDDAVSYVHSLAEAVEAVDTRACRMCVLVRATPVAQIVAVAEAGESMPAKSTFFHPKLPSGLVIHPLVS